MVKMKYLASCEDFATMWHGFCCGIWHWISG